MAGNQNQTDTREPGGILDHRTFGLRSVLRDSRLLSRLVFGLAALFILFPGWAFARNFYVDFRNGNDMNSGTSATSPWKRCPGDRLYSGKRGLRPGDTVYFKRGITYRGMIKTVSPSVVYTVTNWGERDAVIDGSGLDACFQVGHNHVTITGGRGKNLVLTGKTVRHAAIWNWADNGLSGSRFSDLRIRGVGGPLSVEGIGIKIGGNRAAYTAHTVGNNLISDCYSAGIKVSGSGTKDIDIHGNILEGNGTLPAERCQVNLSSNEGNGVQKVRFHDNIVRNGGPKANGINCNNANNEIYNNTISGNSGHGISLSLNYNKNYSGITRVFSNTIRENSGGYGIISGNSDTSRHVLIYNNLLIDNGWYDLNFTDASSHNQVYNNTFYRSRPGHGVRVQKGCEANILNNNIVWTSSGYAIHDSTGTLAEDFNVLYRSSGGPTVVWKDRIYNDSGNYRNESGQGTHSLWENPLFHDISALRPGPYSPCLGTGINLSSIFDVDKNGMARPKSGGWDRGAYQSEAAAGEIGRRKE